MEVEPFCHQIDKLKRTVPRRQLLSHSRYIYCELLIKNLSEDKFFSFVLAYEIFNETLRDCKILWIFLLKKIKQYIIRCRKRKTWIFNDSLISPNISHLWRRARISAKGTEKPFNHDLFYPLCFRSFSLSSHLRDLLAACSSKCNVSRGCISAPCQSSANLTCAGARADERNAAYKVGDFKVMTIN